jgi:hypothetical protein
MPWVRASELDTVLACPGSLVLPRLGDEAKSPKAREGAAWGHAMHSWKATGVVPETPGYPRHAELISARLKYADRNELWPGGLHEVAMSRDSVTGDTRTVKALDDVAWKAAQSATCEVGTADYVGGLFDELWVDDLKTGAWPPTPPEHSLQLRWYTMVAWFAAGSPKTGAWGTITHWPRYPKDGSPRRLGPAHYTAKVLLEFAERVSKVYRQHGGPLRVMSFNPSESACKFCPSRTFCHERYDSQERVH